MDINDKQFCTHEQLILKLTQDRKMEVTDEEYVIRVLEREGYYNLINGYKEPFLKMPSEGDGCSEGESEEFIPGTKIQELLAIYNFDRELRQVLLKRLLHIETHMKNLIAYRFSMQYGHDNFLKYKNFNISSKTKYDDVTVLIAEIHRQISEKTGDPCISHYLTKYAYIPLWVMNCVLTFGTISKFYSLMKDADKEYIAKKISLRKDDLENIMHVVSAGRNMCAHGNRIYCYRTRRVLNDFPIHMQLGINRKAEGGEFEMGKRDLLAVVLAMKMLLPKKEFKNMVFNINYHYKKMSKKLQTISGDAILAKMGFPNDWLTKLTQ